MWSKVELKISELTLCHRRSCQQMLGIRRSTGLAGFRMTVSRQGRRPYCSRRRKGDSTRRKALYLGSTTTVGFDDGRDIRLDSARRSMSWRRNPVRIPAPLAARRCAIVSDGFDASPGTVRSFSPSAPDEADHNLPSSAVELSARKGGSGGPNSSPGDRRLSKDPVLTPSANSVAVGSARDEQQTFGPDFCAS